MCKDTAEPVDATTLPRVRMSGAPTFTISATAAMLGMCSSAHSRETTGLLAPASSHTEAKVRAVTVAASDVGPKAIDAPATNREALMQPGWGQRSAVRGRGGCQKGPQSGAIASGVAIPLASIVHGNVRCTELEVRMLRRLDDDTRCRFINMSRSRDVGCSPQAEAPAIDAAAIVSVVTLFGRVRLTMMEAKMLQKLPPEQHAALLHEARARTPRAQAPVGGLVGEFVNPPWTSRARTSPPERPESDFPLIAGFFWVFLADTGFVSRRESSTQYAVRSTRRFAEHRSLSWAWAKDRSSGIGRSRRALEHP